MSDQLVNAVVICRSAAEPLTSREYTLGYNCNSCGKALQVSPSGIAQIARGWTSDNGPYVNSDHRKADEQGFGSIIPTA
jgi:hypothetical protein